MMSEQCGPLTQRQHLEAELRRVKPECLCSQSKIIRATGVRLILNNLTDIESGQKAVDSILTGCKGSQTVYKGCDAFEICTFDGLSSKSIDEGVSLLRTKLNLNTLE